jgi:ribonuclease HII
VKLPKWDREALSLKEGSAFVFGGDEVGRGCLAGPVCVAMVELNPALISEFSSLSIRDSKLVPEAEREAMYSRIIDLSLRWGVGFASPEEIDRWNILRATELAFGRAWISAWKNEIQQRLAGTVYTDGHLALLSRALGRKEFNLDGERISDLMFVEHPVVKGDLQVVSIAAASILAKVSRDREMRLLHQRFPEFGFDQHKGYLTADHLENLRRVGPCSAHRMSFAPLKQGDLFSRSAL